MAFKKGDKNISVLADPSKAQEIGRKGGLAKAERAEERKTFKEIFNEMLVLPCLCVDEYAAWILENYPNANYAEAVALAMLRRAMLGDVSAAAFIRDSVGENPKTMIDLNSDKETEINIKVIDVG